MTAERERVLDRIKKLLALSTSSNAHEAGLAAAQAAELQLRHRIAAVELEDSDDEPDAPEQIELDVDEYVEQRFGQLKGGRTSAGRRSEDGFEAGREAGREASLGGGRALGQGAKQIGGES